MSAKALLEIPGNPIFVAAFTATFGGQPDENSLATKFADIAAKGFANAIKSYIGLCIGLPIGGPITPGAPSLLKLDLQKTFKDALTETFQGEKDENGIATKFGSKLSELATEFPTYLSTCITVPASPPLVPLSPGGPVICISPPAAISAKLVSLGKDALVETFDGESDSSGISAMFGAALSPLGLLIQPYILTCIAPPGGGPIMAQ